MIPSGESKGTIFVFPNCKVFTLKAFEIIALYARQLVSGSFIHEIEKIIPVSWTAILQWFGVKLYFNKEYNVELFFESIENVAVPPYCLILSNNSIIW